MIGERCGSGKGILAQPRSHARSPLPALCCAGCPRPAPAPALRRASRAPVPAPSVSPHAGLPDHPPPAAAPRPVVVLTRGTGSARPAPFAAEFPRHAHLPLGRLRACPGTLGVAPCGPPGSPAAPRPVVVLTRGTGSARPAPFAAEFPRHAHLPLGRLRACPGTLGVAPCGPPGSPAASRRAAPCRRRCPGHRIRQTGPLRGRVPASCPPPSRPPMRLSRHPRCRPMRDPRLTRRQPPRPVAVLTRDKGSARPAPFAAGPLSRRPVGRPWPGGVCSGPRPVKRRTRRRKVSTPPGRMPAPCPRRARPLVCCARPSAGCRPRALRGPPPGSRPVARCAACSARVSFRAAVGAQPLGNRARCRPPVRPPGPLGRLPPARPLRTPRRAPPPALCRALSPSFPKASDRPPSLPVVSPAAPSGAHGPQSASLAPARDAACCGARGPQPVPVARSRGAGARRGGRCARMGAPWRASKPMSVAPPRSPTTRSRSARPSRWRTSAVQP